MKSRNYSIVIGVMLMLMLGMLNLPLLAQHHDAQHKDEGMIHVGKKGDMNLSSPLRISANSLRLCGVVFLSFSHTVSPNLIAWKIFIRSSRTISTMNAITKSTPKSR